MKYFCSFKNGKEKNKHVIQVSMQRAMWNEKGKLLHETVNYEILKTSCIYTYNLLIYFDTLFQKTADKF